MTLIPAPRGGIAPLAQAAAKTRTYIQESIPENTRRAYSADWKDFSGWCDESDLSALPADPTTVATYLVSLAGKKSPATIRRRAAAIAKAHSMKNLPNPTDTEVVRAALKGVNRIHGVAPTRKAPATLGVVERLVAAAEAPGKDTLGAIRTRALILIGYAGAFRRSELVGLDVRDLAWSEKGVVVTVRRSKTDQEGVGMLKAIPYVDSPLCAAKALRRWLAAAQITQGPVFRGLTIDGASVRQTRMNAGTVAEIVKATAKAAGLDPALFSGHSLRAGHVTEARSRKAPDSDLMAVTGHRRVETLDGYDRRGNPFDRGTAATVLKR